MDQENYQRHRHNDVNPLFVGLLGVIAGAIIVATLHFMMLGWCSNREERQSATGESQQPRNVQIVRSSNREHIASSNSMSNSSLQIIPIFKYTKGFKEGTCAICLGEFKEEDEIRVLPECAHPFHVPCIDMWLYSHPNCPLCRADIVSPRPGHAVLSLSEDAIVSPQPDHVVVSLSEDAGAIPSPEISSVNQ